MAKFNFEMQPILNFKEQVERQKELDFAKALKLVNAEKEKLNSFYNEKDYSLKKLKNEAGKENLDFAQFKFLNNYIEHLKISITRQKDVIMKAEIILEQKRLILTEAMKERKMLDKLKENKFENFLEEEKRAEQKVIDEIVSYKKNINVGEVI